MRARRERIGVKIDEVSIELHDGDLPDGVDFGDCVAIDTETTGLHLHRDRLCLVQMSAGNGVCHLVRFPAAPQAAGRDGALHAPNLRAVLADESVVKLFHFARFDVAMLQRHLAVTCGPIYCTKIASKLIRTYTDRHGLKDLCRELLGVELAKEQQCSDWGAPTLTDEQLKYAASDVLYLHDIRAKLNEMLVREGRAELAAACFRFLAERVRLDLRGWENEDIFSH
jgi:ribonuclease D